MNFSKLFFIFVVFSFFNGCPFDENRRIEKLLEESEIKFHALYNQDKFKEIYADSDEELKNKFTESQFVSFLQSKKNEIGLINDEPHIWISDEIKDGIKRLWFTRSKFSNVEMIYTEKAIYREKYEWNLRGSEAKLASYEIEKLCNKPCRLVIKTE